MSRRGYRRLAIASYCVACAAVAALAISSRYMAVCAYPPLFLVIDCGMVDGGVVRPDPVGLSPALDIRLVNHRTVPRFQLHWLWLPLVEWGPGGPQVVIPLWIPCVSFTVAAVYFHRKARGPKPGHCRKCQYDLTGNESGVCPECGSSTSSKANGREA